MSNNFKPIINEIKKLKNHTKFISAKDITDLKQYIHVNIPTVHYLQLLYCIFHIFKFSVLRSIYNKKFIKISLQQFKTFFDHAAAFPLDLQQRIAVIKDEQNNLVIAGAGSGKTMTIVAKIKYLVEILQIDPKTILPISFTHKSAEEMSHRIQLDGIKSQTFHAFCLKVIYSIEQKTPKLFCNSGLKKLFEQWLKELIQNPIFLSSFNFFLINLFKIPKPKNKFQTQNQYKNYTAMSNFTEIRTGKKLYSAEKYLFANFLWQNGVEYNIPIKSNKKITADFEIINVNHEKVYIDIIDIQGINIPSFLIQQHETYHSAFYRFQKILNFRQNYYRKRNLKYLQVSTTEIFNTEQIRFNSIQEKLQSLDIKLQPISQTEIWSKINQNYSSQIEDFITLSITFLNLMKGGQYNFAEIEYKNQTLKQSKFIRNRSTAFIELFKKLFQQYQNYLLRENQIDFNDMISKASNYIKAGNYHPTINYVIVDEFQDLSLGRYRLLQAIRQQNPYVKFFCVGDDWQSIYRFAGSDVSLFSNFSHYFGHTEVSRIETTYRFCQPAIDFSSNFILSNPSQVHKKIKSGRKDRTFLKIIEYDSTNSYNQAIISAVNLLIKLGATTKHSMCLIGRYNFDINKIKPDKGITIADQLVTIEAQNTKYTFEFLTAHKSKGLEADYVILVNCESGYHGFPSDRIDDPILSLVTDTSDQFEYNEERRLFYVAITRAKRGTIIISNRNHPSPFVDEVKTLISQKNH